MKSNNELIRLQQLILRARNAPDRSQLILEIEEFGKSSSAEIQADVHYHLGVLHELEEDFVAAKRNWELAVELVQTGSYLSFQLASALGRANWKLAGTSEAAYWYRRALDSGYCDPLTMKEFIELLSGHFDDSDKSLIYGVIRQNWQTLGLAGEPDHDVFEALHALTTRLREFGNQEPLQIGASVEIARRELEWVDSGAIVHTVSIILYKPIENLGEERGYLCSYQIVGLDYQRTGQIHAADSIASLQTAMRAIGRELEEIRGTIHGQLRWGFSRDESLGFP